MEPLIKNVLDTLAGLGNSEKVALFSVQTGSQICVIAGGFSNGEFMLPGKYIDFTGTPLEVIIATKQPSTYPGTFVEDLPFPSYDDVNSGFECLCMPLLDKEADQVIAVAVLAQEVGISVPDYRMQTLSMLRTLIASTMENARLFQLATTDSLTGLYTRRYFDIRLQEELVRIRRYGGVMTLFMMDIDHFKRVNDTFGHQQGDVVLQEFAAILHKSVRREIDLPCRYGGEEFIAMLPSTDIDGGYILAERIRQRCEQHHFTPLQGEPLRITMSGGLASVNQAMKVSKEQLVHCADVMLYAAKQGGRNRIMKYMDSAGSATP